MWMPGMFGACVCGVWGGVLCGALILSPERRADHCRTWEAPLAWRFILNFYNTSLSSVHTVFFTLPKKRQFSHENSRKKMGPEIEGVLPG
jgi:hypothetical protein